MKIHKIHEITFDMEETILSATVSKKNEIVMLLSSGLVGRYTINEPLGERLFSVIDNIGYTYGRFNLTAQTSLYTLDEIVVVVNDYKTDGYIHYPGKYHALHFSRKDKCADISMYPLALYKNEDGVPHVIFAVAWNHIQIMNLDTRQILTAAKSLIEENAEEKHIEFYKKYSEDNKLFWPSPYDYFFGKLLMSPNRKRFLSVGWYWGSYDYYTVYDVENFITSNRISDIPIGNWEHLNRSTCWIDNDTIAVSYNPLIDDDEDATPESPFEIHFYKIDGKTAEIVKKIQVEDKNILYSKLYYNKELDAFIVVSDKIGISILSLDGQILLKDETLKVDEYSLETGFFINTENKMITLYDIIE
ncbi:MAG: hypothetical protein IPM69_02455 [Ignavibacteria bacterium]|nr:hypothetical protein [Ignavibacteria bacterium]